MDWSSIAAAAIYGAIGGGFGALAGMFVAAPFRNFRVGKTVLTVCTVGGAIVGYNVAQPLLEPYLGGAIKSVVGKTSLDDAADSAISDMRADPLLAAILDADPELEKTLRADFSRILRNSEDAATARVEAFNVGYNTVVTQFTYYLPRATDEDLISFVTVLTENLEYLSVADPGFCYQFLYDTQSFVGMSVETIKAKFGGDRHMRQQEAAAAVVQNSYDEVPAYDQQAAQEKVDAAGMVVFAELGEEKIGLITMGQKPATDADAAAACRATYKMYQRLLAEDNAADSIRHLFVLVGHGG